MSEKRINVMKIMMTDTEKDTVLNKVKELKAKGEDKKINASDVIRACIEKWFKVQEKIKEGYSMCFVPVSKEIIDNKRAMIELGDLSKDEKISPHTRKILHEMAESMEFHVYSQLREKYPNYDGLYNMSSVEDDV